MNGIIRITTVFCLAMLLSLAQAAGIYKWTDQDGVVHYGEQPPDQDAQELNIRHRPARPEAAPPVETVKDPRAERDRIGKAMEGDRLAREEKKQKQRQGQDELKMQCAKARDALQRYMQAASLYELDKDGGRRTLSEQAKQQEIKRLQDQIQQHCK